MVFHRSPNEFVTLPNVSVEFNVGKSLLIPEANTKFLLKSTILNPNQLRIVLVSVAVVG